MRMYFQTAGKVFIAGKRGERFVSFGFDFIVLVGIDIHLHSRRFHNQERNLNLIVANRGGIVNSSERAISIGDGSGREMEKAAVAGWRKQRLRDDENDNRGMERAAVARW